jgi:hypothetical protein
MAEKCKTSRDVEVDMGIGDGGSDWTDEELRSAVEILVRNQQKVVGNSDPKLANYIRLIEKMRRDRALG